MSCVFSVEKLCREKVEKKHTRQLLKMLNNHRYFLDLFNYCGLAGKFCDNFDECFDNMEYNCMIIREVLSTRRHNSKQYCGKYHN